MDIKLHSVLLLICDSNALRTFISYFVQMTLDSATRFINLLMAKSREILVTKLVFIFSLWIMSIFFICFYFSVLQIENLVIALSLYHQNLSIKAKFLDILLYRRMTG